MTDTMNTARTEARPFDALVNYFVEHDAVDVQVREAALAIGGKLRNLGEVPVGAQATILNGPASMWLEAREGEGADSSQAQTAIQQLETCRIGTCQGIIFDVNSLQVATSQLDRLGGTDGERRSQSLVEPTLNTIRDDLALLHFTTLARAGMLCAENDADACMKTLNDYLAFLDGTILQNAALLERLADDGESWKALGEAVAAFKSATE